MRNQSTKTERNQGSDDAKKTNIGACADREVFSRLPNRLMGDHFTGGSDLKAEGTIGGF